MLGPPDSPGRCISANPVRTAPRRPQGSFPPPAGPFLPFRSRSSLSTPCHDCHTAASQYQPMQANPIPYCPCGPVLAEPFHAVSILPVRNLTSGPLPSAPILSSTANPIADRPNLAPPCHIDPFLPIHIKPRRTDPGLAFALLPILTSPSQSMRQRYTPLLPIRVHPGLCRPVHYCPTRFAPSPSVSNHSSPRRRPFTCTHHHALNI